MAGIMDVHSRHNSKYAALNDQTKGGVLPSEDCIQPTGEMWGMLHLNIWQNMRNGARTAITIAQN